MAGGEIDRLEIKVASEVGRASKNLDTLVTKLNTLNGSLLRVNGSGLNGLANGVMKLGNAMKSMQSVKTSDFSKLSRNIQKLSSINAQQLYTTASAMNTIASSLRGLSGISESASSLSEFAKNISKLGNKSVQSAITNMPLLAQGVNDLMSKLSKAPQVSSNLIKMTEALSQLTAHGNKVGSAGRSMTSVLNGYDKMAKKSTASSKGLASSIGLLYAKFWIFIRAFKWLAGAVNSAGDFLETVNYFEVAMRKIGSSASSQWQENGYNSAEAYVDSFAKRSKELTAKMTGYTIDAAGNTMETGMGNLGLNPDDVMQYQAMFGQMAESMGSTAETALNVSDALTRLGADWASLRNMDMTDAWGKMASALASQSRAVRIFGIDITQTMLQEEAYRNGVTQSVSEMNQATKTQLRMLVMLRQSKVAYGDLANTIGSYANQVRIMKNNMSNLARAIGNVFLPVIAKVLPYINGFIIALTKMFSWLKGILGIKFDSINTSIGQGSDSLDDLLGTTTDEADALDDAAKSASKLNKQLRAWDELNNLSSDSDSGGGTSTGGTSTGGVPNLDAAIGDALAEYEKKWDEAFGRMENKAQTFADNLTKFFTNMYNATEPFRKAVINLWDNGLSKLADFSFTALTDFYENLLVPLGKWAFGTEDKGLTRLVNIINDSLMKIDWATINKNLKEFWIAIEPYAENFGEGLIDFFEDMSGIAVDSINKIFGKDGALQNLTKALKDGNPKDAEAWGYGLGQLVVGLIAFKALVGVSTIISAIALSISKLAKALDILAGTKAVTFVSGIAKGISNFLFLSGVSTTIGNIATALGNLASINPGSIGELGIYLSRLAEGTIFDTSTWTGIPKIINDGIYAGINAIANGIGTLITYLGTIAEKLWDNTIAIFQKAATNFEKGGAYILLGIVQGFAGAAGLIVEPIVDLFNLVWNKLCEVFGIHSPATEMQPIGINILLGIVEGFKSAFASFTEAMVIFWDSYVLPWFTVDGWSTMFSNIGIALGNTWTVISTDWTTNISTWWTASVLPWFTLAKWLTLFEKIKTALKTTWDLTALQWKTNIAKWWNESVEPWFSAEKWEEIGENMKNGIYDGFRGIVANVIGVLNGLLDGVENLVNMAIDGLNELIEKADSAPGVNIDFRIKPISFGTIPTPTFKTGGFPEDGLFYANHNELVGKFSNGRTAVANNEQITSGIAVGVENANQGVISAIVSMTNNIVSAVLSGLTVEIDGQAVFNTVKSQADNYSKMYNEPAF